MEIKLRVLNKTTGDLIGYERVNDSGQWEFQRVNRTEWLLGVITDNNMQEGHIRELFTGLYDKNKQPIYNLDVVNMRYDEPLDRPHITVWHLNKFIAVHLCEYEKFIAGNDGIYFSNTGKTPNAFDAEIIGNIHTSPSLLKEMK